MRDVESLATLEVKCDGTAGASAFGAVGKAQLIARKIVAPLYAFKASGKILEFSHRSIVRFAIPT
jgi:hypothetical protein